MSITPTPLPESTQPTPRPRRRVARFFLHLFLWTLSVFAIVAIGLTIFASTPTFENRIRHAVIAELEKSTGGRVELQHFGWRFTHLEFEADNLTIHGLEAPGEIPYAHLDRLFVRLQILSFFHPKISLNYLEADHPVIHLIVYPDGSTNQPQPKHPSTGDTKNEIFNLAIGRTVLSNGLAIFNQRSIPFNLTANNLAAQVSYVPANDHVPAHDHYTGTIHVEDIVALNGPQTRANVPVHSTLDASLDVGRNTANLVSLTLQSGPENKSQKTVIRIAGSLNGFTNPHFQFTAKGAIDALEIRALAGVPGIDAGTAQLDASGQGTFSQFTIDSTAAVSGGAYSIGTVDITGATVHALAHIDQNQIAITGVHVSVAGGTVDGEMHVVNWLTPTPSPNQSRHTKVPVEKGTVRTHVANFSLDRILDLVAPPGYRRLGFDTAASGSANVDWTGSADDLIGAADVTLAPPVPAAPGEVPVTGIVQAQYVQHNGSVAVGRVDVHTPASDIQASGTLGVYPTSRPTEINASLITRNVAEFNPVLATLGISAPGQPTPIPANLHGQAQFHGEFTGTLDAPDFRGHLQATDFDVTPRASTPAATLAIKNIHFDSLTADADYNYGALSVSAATLVQGKTTIQFSGQVHGNPKEPAELFAPTSTLHVSAQARNVDVQQWIALTGQNYPVSGTLNVSAQASGTIGDLNGGGHVSLTNGAIEGESYRSLSTDLQFQGKAVNATNLVFALDGGRITGSGGYDFGANTVQFNLQGSGFELAHIRRIQNDQYPLAGSVDFNAHGSGPLKNPSLQASLHMRNLSLTRAATGFVDVEAHTTGQTLDLHANAHLNTATVDLTSETQLNGDYETAGQPQHLQI